MSDYRKATGFEALMGYLYLKDEFERLVELVKTGAEEWKTKTIVISCKRRMNWRDEITIREREKEFHGI